MLGAGVTNCTDTYTATVIIFYGEKMSFLLRSEGEYVIDVTACRGGNK